VADTVDVVEPITKFTKELEGKPGVGRIFNVGLEGWPVAAEGDEAEAEAEAEADDGVGEIQVDDGDNDNDDEDDFNDGDGGEQYNLIWIQWCAGQLRDAQLIEFLHRCKGRLSDDGVVVIKENNSTSGVDVFDDLDSCVTRSVNPGLKQVLPSYPLTQAESSPCFRESILAARKLPPPFTFAFRHPPVPRPCPRCPPGLAAGRAETGVACPPPSRAFLLPVLFFFFSLFPAERPCWLALFHSFLLPAFSTYSHPSHHPPRLISCLS
jgi:hypothetical protein